MVLTEHLNPQQKEAVLHTEGPLLVLAGAGSGKTRVLTYRVAHLIENLKVRPDNILAITFTNKAAKEMKERIYDLVGSKAENTWISTFHSTCVRILRREIEKIGFTRNFVIYDTDDQLTLVKDCIKELDLSEKYFNPKDIRYRIGELKDQILSPEDYRKEIQGQYREEKIADIYKLYQDKLSKNNALDFDDLINRTLELFYLRPDVLDYYSSKFQYILVDEYQDTNYAQYMLVKLLSMKHQNLCVVGDDDQSIYGWRGADIRNILEFEKDFPNTKIIKLEENYRSTQIILDAANEVIKNNTGRKEKRLWTEKGQGEKIFVYKVSDERQEADIICQHIHKHIVSDNKDPGDFAILYRTNAQSRAIEDALMRYGIPYRMYGGLRFYDRKEIKDIIAYLRVIANPADDVSLRRIINVPRRGIGNATLTTLEEVAIRENESIFSIILDLAQYDDFTSRTSKKIKEFGEMISYLIAMKEVMPITEFIKTLLEHTGYEKALKEEKSVDSESRLENIREFLSAAQEFEQENENADLVDFLENIALVSDLDTLGEEQSAVNMMTMHSAKGLEFPVVFIAGMEEYLFPHARAMESEQEMEEERRLCYVGITRAQEQLYLIYAERRNIFGNYTSNMPSRFLDEIPESLVEHFDQTPGNIWSSRSVYSTGYSANTYQHKSSSQQDNEFKMKSQNDRGFTLGQKVVHKKFGKGTIVALSGEGEEQELKIAFDQGGIRSFIAAYAPLKKID
ncbi:MAG: DNA helicase PcrA [Caldicoprobacterales bacterium]|jgi:DNA helicase-2/ATP-dependent DNA helicase PcrA|nr:DNA helicase PcrA [Clostridiales bacterium]